jgi:tRNA-specific 2-thiouridylase
VKENLIYVGQGNDHPGLARKGLFVASKDVHWVREDLKMQIGEHRSYLARIRYRQPLSKVTLHLEEEGLYVIFDEKQQSVTPGQFVAWYEGEELIGSGVIA